MSLKKGGLVQMLQRRRKGHLYLVVSNPPPPPDDDEPASHEDTEANKKKIHSLMEGLPPKMQWQIIRLAEEMVRFNRGG